MIERSQWRRAPQLAVNQMHTFFHGWRRKAGCVALVIACAITVVWVRSCLVIDNVRIPIGNRRVDLATCRGSLFFEVLPVPTHRNPNVPQPAFRNQFRWLVSQINPTLRSETWNLRGPIWCIPFRQFAVVFALLSAYLILRKPRPTRKPADSGSGSSQRHRDTERDKNTLTNNVDLPSVSVTL